MVSYVHPLFLWAHSAASKLDNPGWLEATQGKFAKTTVRPWNSNYSLWHQLKHGK
jgi:hypothetical protein